MIEQAQDDAIQYIFGDLNAVEAKRFEARIASDAELRALVDDLNDTTSAIANVLPPLAPPPALRKRVLDGAQHGKVVSFPLRAPQNVRWLPWAIAASLAVATTMLFLERQRLSGDLAHVVALNKEFETREKDSLVTNDKLSQEIASLKKQDALAQVKIATLSAQVGAYSQSVAVVVWDGAEQRGVAKFDKLPPAGKGKDYQLWVIDPKASGPVSAGVVSNQGGVSQISFRPAQPVTSADKFAISVERTGGAAAPAGPIVLISP